VDDLFIDSLKTSSCYEWKKGLKHMK